MSYQATFDGTRALLALEKMQKEGTLHTQIDLLLNRAGQIYRERPEPITPGYQDVIDEASHIASLFTDLFHGLVTARLEGPPPGRERGKVCLTGES